MTENPNAATTPVDPDPEARPADVTCPSPPAPVGRPAGAESVEAVKHCDLLARPPIWPPRRDDRQHRFRLRSGDWVSVRQLRPGDAPALAAAVERLSALSRYRRFHSALPRLTEQMISYLTDIDHHDHEALVAVPPGTGGIIVGVARFIRDPAHPDTAEVAVAVADSWQRRGLGTLLLRRLARRASEVGISSVTGDILAENRPTIELARRLGARSMDNHGSTVTTRMDIADCAVDDSDAGSLLRALAAAESSWAAADPADAGLVCRTHPDARRPARRQASSSSHHCQACRSMWWRRCRAARIPAHPRVRAVVSRRSVGGRLHPAVRWWARPAAASCSRYCLVAACRTRCASRCAGCPCAGGGCPQTGHAAC
jgi:RimJ/RimL family protein N-acetyltransferase